MTDSPYYPPRAGTLSPLWNWLGRIAHSDVIARLHTNADVTLFGFFAALLIPGMGIFLRRPFYGRYALPACGIYAVVFIVALGYPIANLAFSGLLCLHAVGCAMYIQPIIRDSGLFYRLVIMLLMVAMVIGAIYLPLLHKCESGWLMPIQYYNRTIVLHVGKPPRHIHRGDWMAYRYDGWERGEIIIRDGVNVAQILAIGGDSIAFTPTNMLVNGVPQPRLGGMPKNAGFTLAENQWFAWAEFGMTGHGLINAQDLSDARVGQGIITPEHYIGAPFRWWFWRNQKLP